MIHYNVWFSFRPNIEESQGLALVHDFLDELHLSGGIAGFRLLKNIGSATKTNMLPFQALIEFRDDAQFQTAFSLQAANGIHNGLHGRIMSLIQDFRIEVFRQISNSSPMK